MSGLLNVILAKILGRSDQQFMTFSESLRKTCLLRKFTLLIAELHFNSADADVCHT